MRHARYRGRHRKRQRPRRLTAVGAVGLGTIAAASILAPSPPTPRPTCSGTASRTASPVATGTTTPATATTAACSSPPSTWSSSTWHDYAPRADLATRAEQMDVADRVLDRAGLGRLAGVLAGGRRLR